METIIQFVGLCVVTSHLLFADQATERHIETRPQSRVVEVILPQVGISRKNGSSPAATKSTSPATLRVSQQSDLNGDPAISMTEVERHTALIAFDSNAFLSIKG